MRHFSVQSLSHVWLFATPWNAARQASLSITNSWSLLKFMSIQPSVLESVCPGFQSLLTLINCVQFSRSAAYQAFLSITNSLTLLKLMYIMSVISSNHLTLCRPLLLPPSIFHSIRVFSSESILCIRWPKYWSFSFSVNPSNEYSELISFRLTGFISLQSNYSSSRVIEWGYSELWHVGPKSQWLGMTKLISYSLAYLVHWVEDIPHWDNHSGAWAERGATILMMLPY